jgi:hypothetical protein
VKPFDPELYAKDDLAKFIVIDWLEGFGIRANVNPDDYGIDLIGYRDGERFEIEVEVKHAWSGATFPFDTLHYSARKLKFLESPATVKFITLNHEWSHCAIVDGEDLDSSQIVEKKTIYTELEKFIEVPIAKVKWGVIHA